MRRTTLFGAAAVAVAALALTATPAFAGGDDFVEVNAARRHVMLMAAGDGQPLEERERCYRALVVKGARNWGTIGIRLPPPSGCHPSDGGPAIVKQRASGRWVGAHRVHRAQRALRAADRCATGGPGRLRLHPLIAAGPGSLADSSAS